MMNPEDSPATVGDVLVVIPTLNEWPHVDDLIARVLDLGPGISILVVDDGSTDGTREVVHRWMEKEDRVFILERPTKQGLGSAYKNGFAWGLAKDFNFFVEMDADLSHDPGDLARIIERSSQGGLTIGSRYVEGGKVEGWSTRRLVLSRLGNIYARLALGFPVRDSTSGFRCYGRELLMDIDIDSVQSEGYGFQIEMAYRSWLRKHPVSEVPIVFRERVGGVSKMSGGIVTEALVRVLKWRFSGPGWNIAERAHPVREAGGSDSADPPR